MAKIDEPDESRTAIPNLSRYPLSDFIALGALVMHVESDTFCLAHDLRNSQWTPPNLSDHKYTLNNRRLLDALAILTRVGWVRILAGSHDVLDRKEIWRLYLLPNDVARSTSDGRKRGHEKLLHEVLTHVDVSPTTWNGKRISNDFGKKKFDPWASSENSSLFYLFNTLPSPNPNPEVIDNHYLRNSVLRLLEEGSPPWGLRTALYPYQRRCVALMLQKENVQGLQLDPRLEARTSPTGDTYYYAPRDDAFLKSPQYYPTCQGGILGETMGLGKTLICIAVMLSTRGQFPSVPLEYEKPHSYSQVRSLADIAAKTIARTSTPWKTLLQDHEDSTGEHIANCHDFMNRQNLFYEIPRQVVRSVRHIDKYSPSERVRVCYGTVLVVPTNLVHQWRSELIKHVEGNALKILSLIDARSMIPSVEDLAQYDVVLFSRSRFEKEDQSSSDIYYVSPLKGLHWLRIIIDEGHGFSSGATRAAVVAEKLVRAERRWIVSGTPARDLLGIEVDVPALASSNTGAGFKEYKYTTLQNRKDFDSAQEQNSGAVKDLGALASKFLKARPWCLSGDAEEGANWSEHIYRHEDYKTRTYTTFSKCLRTTLEDLMIKTRPEDVEKDLKLPPLHHRVIRLEPSSFDKMTANLFVLLFTTNAVTSERRDQDYLFHASSQRHLRRLTKNLRQSSFYWVGFKPKDVSSSIRTGEKYLAKHDISCAGADRSRLTNIMHIAERIHNSPTWRALSQSTEMGLFVKDWPEGYEDPWAFENCKHPLMIGLTQLMESQRYVNDRLNSENPLRDFDVAGLEAGLEAKRRVSEEDDALANKNARQERNEIDSESPKAGIPSSSYGDGAMGSKRVSVTGASRAKPKVKLSSPSSKSITPKKRKISNNKNLVDLDPSTSSLARTQMIGTVSSKFSYLIDSISSLHKREKILVFYDANYVAFYLSQALDLLDIKHLIYTSKISSEQRSKYTVLFNNDESHRVLIMDIQQAAHGLNLSSASRVFFINPPYRPEIEAQAIKRAHRIGQTRPVHVETLVLRGTVEEAIYERTIRMTKREHLAAKLLEEDHDIRTIIQDQRVIMLEDCELTGQRAMAPLQVPHQIFGRPDRAGKTTAGTLERDIFGIGTEQSSNDANEASGIAKPKKRKRNNREPDRGGGLLPNTRDQGQVISEASRPMTSLFGGS